MSWLGVSVTQMLPQFGMSILPLQPLSSIPSPNHVATGALSEEPEWGGVVEAELMGLWLLLPLLLLLLLLMLVVVLVVVAPLVLEFSECSVSALILRQVVAPRALAKWSSTEPVKTLREGSFWDLMAFHVESPRALAKWSSTDSATTDTSSL